MQKKHAQEKVESSSRVNPLQLPRMIMHPLRNRFHFILESLLLGGTLARLLLAAALITAVAFLGGGIAFIAVSRGTQAFASPFDAIWWAFLRLSDPGYLGDDEGLVLRIVSTTLTIAGYVLFLGVLVAILTQGLNEKIRRLELGLTPVSARHHVILLGWPVRMPEIVRNLLASGQRVERFLRRTGARRLQVLLLVEQLSQLHTHELRTRLGHGWRRRELIIRSGTPLRLDHLKRVDYLRASTIVLPAADPDAHQDASAVDDAAVKTLLSIANSVHLAKPEGAQPLLVAEFHDARKIPIVLNNYDGPIEVLARDQMVSRILAQMIRHPRISLVHRELLSHAEGNEFFVRDCPQSLLHTPFWDLAQRFPAAVLVGVTHSSAPNRSRPLLNPPPDYRLRAGDKLVYVAEDWQKGTPAEHPSGASWVPPTRPLERMTRPMQKVLVLGWSGRLPTLLSELETYSSRHFSITVVSRFPIVERCRQLDHFAARLDRVTLEHVEADYTLPERLAEQGPGSFDTILCLATDLSVSEQAADARTLVTYAILKDLIDPSRKRPRILIELLDELNAALLDPRRCEYLLSPKVLSNMLVQVALRRELHAVFRSLFDSSSTELLFRDFQRYNLPTGKALRFEELQARGREHGEIVLGLFQNEFADGAAHLNPDRSRSWTLEEGDQLIVIGRS